MAAEWYYEANRQQVGPVELKALREMLQTGAVAAGARVFGPGLTEWAPADQTPALRGDLVSIAGAAQVDPSQTGEAPMLTYRGVPAGDAGISERAINLFRQTKPWTRFVSIMMFIGAGLMVAGALVMAGVGMMTRGASGPPIIVMAGSAMYLLMGVLYVAPAIYLNRFTNAVGRLMLTRGSTELEEALAGQKSFWKFIGIMIIVVISAYILFVMAMVFKLIHF